MEQRNIKRLERTVVVLGAVAILLGLLAAILLVVTAPAAHAAAIDVEPHGVHVGGICEAIVLVAFSLFIITLMRLQKR